MFEEIFLSALQLIVTLFYSPARRFLTAVRRQFSSRNEASRDYRGRNDLSAYRSLFEELLQVSVGREEQLQLALDHLSQQEPCRLLVEAPSGYGKTTFFAMLKAALEAKKVQLVWHPFSRSIYPDPSGDAERFDTNIAEQLAWYLGDDISQLANRRNYVINHLAQPHREVVLLLDALDETDTRWLRSRLPHSQPDGLKMLVTARTLGTDSLLDEAGLYRSSFDRVLELPPLTQTEIACLMARMSLPVAESCKVLEVTQGDPFFVRYLLQDLRDGKAQDVLAGRPPSLEQYLEAQFDQLTGHATELQAMLLTQIVLSPGPVPRHDLIRMIPKLTPLNFRPLFRPLRRFFLETDRGYVVCHSRFKEFFREQLKASE